MKKIKNAKYKKTRRCFIVLGIFLIFFFLSHLFNSSMEPQLQAIARQHTGFAINNIVKEVLADMEYDPKQLYTIDKSSDGEVSTVNFNSYKLNQLLYSSLNTIDKSLLAAQDGKRDPTTKDVFYTDGIVYQVPLGYLTRVFFLYDKGPRINVKMRLLNDVTGEIRTEVKEYGVNSSVIEIKLVVHVDAQVITFLSTSRLENECEIPLVIQVINGKVPEYLPYTKNSS